ncbi:AAA family ATPase [Paenibacillus sp. GCM10012307]|uniref:AAA family ATPase n=1 Tax=Paenibacillus roseus TaxID=2798579 RepID=A0A934IWR8_9BACL|nr:AAA family ATPase [Paenibacillus roseus]MBJ6360722.1 AAA family ATPase [Paenibacillus roseus]
MTVDFIIVHGSPGSGKTTLAKKLHEYYESPYFEFGWISEFRMLAPSIRSTQRQEEQLSFENLVAVAKNYNKHGYKNVILTDLDDVRNALKTAKPDSDHEAKGIIKQLHERKRRENSPPSTTV